MSRIATTAHKGATIQEADRPFRSLLGERDSRIGVASVGAEVTAGRTAESQTAEASRSLTGEIIE